ncbi:uncharacterized protein LOC123008618 isoform X1 [Tribolium madens]|uniref:uncharacterized protein LOC123008618 isoform X1 n=1 Tax=Tribolium madens TaxID=41895 RepID=UPI001CF75529|nr:uncharacterized protein LOC123008618 isoform X1 [Tribolium madens]
MESHQTKPLYSCEALHSIISNLRATPKDYMIRTYFHIKNITSGPEYDKYKHRLNNVIFNNLFNIVTELTVSIYFPKCQQLVYSDLGTIRFLSCIYPNTITSGFYPVFVQYFDRKEGIKHRLLDYTSRVSEVASILVYFGVIGQIVGYCGDYCYRDSVNSTSSDHFQSLKILTRGNIMDLPYSDNFLSTLMGFLVDYLPENVILALDKLGDVFVNNSGNSQIARELVSEYKKWKRSNEHVLLSSYTNFVIEHLVALNAYLERFKCLPYSVGCLFSSVLNRFMLVFTTDIYKEIDKIKMSDNCAVIYYFHLVRIRDLFKCYEDLGYIPLRARNFLDSEINYLVTSQVVDLAKDDKSLEKLQKEITVIVDLFYTRAKIYIETLLLQFPNFDTFDWILFPVDYSKVHKTFHLLKETERNCQTCHQLYLEVKNLDSLIRKLPLDEIESVVEKWLLVLKECEFPIIGELLEYLLSLPASYKVMEDLEAWKSDECAKKVVKMTVDCLTLDEIEEVFEDYYWEDATNIIKRLQIPALED